MGVTFNPTKTESLLISRKINQPVSSNNCKAFLLGIIVIVLQINTIEQKLTFKAVERLHQDQWPKLVESYVHGLQCNSFKCYIQICPLFSTGSTQEDPSRHD